MSHIYTCQNWLLSDWAATEVSGRSNMPSNWSGLVWDILAPQIYQIPGDEDRDSS
jgi:hypothetical protein